MPSFYTPHLNKSDSSLVISDEEYHHLVHVFRKNVNDEILLTSGNGTLATARIENITKKEVTVSILDIKEEELSQPKIAFAFPLLKNKHDHLIVEKLTELGVKEFFPIETIRTVRKASKNTVEKFEKIAIAAIKQCDNALLPQIHPVADLDAQLDKIRENGFQPVVAVETGKHELLPKVVAEQDKPVCLVIGPEGGFAADEIDYFQSNQIPSFTLGNHILRAETAAIASVSQLLVYYLTQNPDYY